MKKLTKEELQIKSNKIHNNKYKVLGEYINSISKIKMLHLECGNEFYQQPNNHLMGKGCLYCYGTKRKTKEEFQNESNIKHNNSYLIVGDYINNETDIEIKHLTCGTIFNSKPSSHLNNYGCCSKCFRTNIKKSKEEFQNESNLKHNYEYLILGDYIGTDDKIEIQHLVCGGVFKQKPYKHLYNNKCPICFGKNPLSKQIIQERSDVLNNSEYLVLGNYVNSQTHINIKHIVCGNEFMQTPTNHLNHNRRCPYCYGNQVKTNDIYQNESNLKHDNEYKLISDYISTHDKVTLEHKLCGEQFDVIAFSHISGSVCPKCYGKTSLGEKRISKILDDNGIVYEKYKKFNGCKYKNQLNYDFYLTDYNICIENDGVQHYEPVEYFGGVDSYNVTVIRDNIKTKYCIDNNIQLLRIRYDEDLDECMSKLINSIYQ